MRKPRLQQSNRRTLQQHLDDLILPWRFRQVRVDIFFPKIFSLVSCGELSLPFVLVSTTVELVDDGVGFDDGALEFGLALGHGDVSFGLCACGLDFMGVAVSSFAFCVEVVDVECAVVAKCGVYSGFSIYAF